ncbi:MAG: acetate--CoA ligase family protein [Candidatus Moranbacteria bacterium]|nr:acetate--CoA ligase family protein [Candidatus Moranbacteria bacterium]
MSKLNKLFNPQSIAIVGASQERGKVGNVITRNILELGYAGKIFLVNPKHEKLFDQRTFKSLTDITEKVDLAIIVLPSKIVVPVIREASDKIKNFVVISAGFSETDAEGKAREEELKKLAEEKDLNILGPNCLGFIIPKLKLNASFAGGMPQAGNISFVSQSGALAVAIMDIARKENIKFANIISVGNKMQLSEAEVLEYLENDESTKVVGMYLEGIENGQKFIEVASRVAQKKPVVILKAGKTEKAQKAISSHTGALAGSNEIMDAVFEKAGVLRAENLEEFFALIETMSVASAPKEKGVAIITNAGGPGVLTTDAFGGKTIELVNLSEETKKSLRAFLPAESSVENPIDLLGDAMEDRYEKALEVLEQDEKIGAILCVLTAQDQTPVGKIVSKIVEFKNRTNKMVATIFIGGERVEKEIARLHENEVPNFVFPDEAVNALNDYYVWNENRKEVVANRKEFVVNIARQAEVSKIIAKVKKEKRTALSFSEASDVAKMYGIATPAVSNLTVDDDLPEIAKFSVVMKVDSDKVLHKTDKQGVILNIKNQEELQQAQAQMKVNFPGENLIIQEMLSIKTELIMGIKQDSIFGPIVVYGLGGIYTEVFKMVNFLVPPLNLAEIKKSLMRSKIKFLFEETRGQKAHNADEMAQMLLGVSELAQEIADIKELDINPVLIYNDGKSAVAVDVKIIVG